MEKAKNLVEVFRSHPEKMEDVRVMYLHNKDHSMRKIKTPPVGGPISVVFPQDLKIENAIKGHYEGLAEKHPHPDPSFYRGDADSARSEYVQWQFLKALDEVVERKDSEIGSLISGANAYDRNEGGWGNFTPYAVEGSKNCLYSIAVQLYEADLDE